MRPSSGAELMRRLVPIYSFHASLQKHLSLGRMFLKAGSRDTASRIRLPRKSGEAKNSGLDARRMIRRCKNTIRAEAGKLPSGRPEPFAGPTMHIQRKLP